MMIRKMSGTKKEKQITKNLSKKRLPNRLSVGPKKENMTKVQRRAKKKTRQVKRRMKAKNLMVQMRWMI